MVFFSLTFMYTFRNPLRNASLIPHPKTANIIVISFPRSGSSFLGEIFNHHPGVFCLFEPLQTVQKLFSGDSLFGFNYSSPSYQNMKVFENINKCKFARDIFTRYLNRQNLSHPFALSSPYCVRNGMSTVCQKLKTRLFEDVCKNNYILFAAKILTPRKLNSRGEWNKNLFESCSSNGARECEILQWADPRVVVNSLKSLEFSRRSHDPRPELSWYIENVCHQMSLMSKSGSWWRRFLLMGLS